MLRYKDDLYVVNKKIMSQLTKMLTERLRLLSVVSFQQFQNVMCQEDGILLLHGIFYLFTLVMSAPLPN